MKFYNTEIPSGLINKLPILFKMPDAIMADIICNTDTVEDREGHIFTSCLMFYITKKYELKSFAEFEDHIKGDPQEHLADFFEEIVRRHRKLK